MSEGHSSEDWRKRKSAEKEAGGEAKAARLWEDEEHRLRRKLLEKKAKGDAHRRPHKRHVMLDDDGDDDAPPIRPPQVSSSVTTAKERRAHHRDRHAERARKRSEADAHGEPARESSRHRSAERGRAPDDKRDDASRQRRINEGWARWKRSLPGKASPKERRSAPEEPPRSDRDADRKARIIKRPSATSLLLQPERPFVAAVAANLAGEVIEPPPDSPTAEERTPTQDEVEDRQATSRADSRSSSTDGEASTTSASSKADTAGSGAAATEKQKYSKFESSEESESDDDRQESESERPSEAEADARPNGAQSPCRPADASPNAAAPSEPSPQQAESNKPAEVEEMIIEEPDRPKLPVYYPGISGCRNVEEFSCLNKIEEGTYGVVFRAKEKRTDEVVALKRLKMEKEKEGFPITSLREINMLLKAGGHENIVNVREIVVGSNMDKIYLVMDYIEHDMKALMESMKQPFLVGEVKTLLRQLLSGVKHLHDNWILHRDLKASNLLLSHRGMLKIGDFGLAREYGSPLKPYTPIVVTLWYRAPELLLGVKEYSTAIDLWSVGCIFGEFLALKPLFAGKGEQDQINRIFKMLGTPSASIWPGYNELPAVKRLTFGQHPYNQLRKHFGATLSDNGFALLNRLLTYNPGRRVNAAEALQHAWFVEEPRPVAPSMFPTWPAKSEHGRAPPTQHRAASPKPPSGGKQFGKESADNDDEKLLAGLRVKPGQTNKGFSLRFDPPKF